MRLDRLDRTPCASADGRGIRPANVPPEAIRPPAVTRTTRMRRAAIPILAGAALAVSAYVHARIWQNEYRHAPVRELFLLSAVGLAAVAVTLLASALPAVPGRLRTAAASAGALAAAASLLAFGLSRGPGLPTLHGRFKETGLEATTSYFFHFGSAKTILVAETIALLACATALAMTVRHDRSRG